MRPYQQSRCRGFMAQIHDGPSSALLKMQPECRNLKPNG